ncbi:hypothetical protein [Streptomyces qinglanensis]|uniref:hypothetical protein n=1 Tax=Streptomyces qinglanensis TaxID=943816 RepID=UPI003D717CB6
MIGSGRTARHARREQLLVLLSRMQRGVLLDVERDLLRAAVDTELADAEEAHAALERARETDARRKNQIALVRDMHRPRAERRESGCVQCGIVWPCPTRRALDRETGEQP